MFSLSELSVCDGALSSTAVAVGCFESGETLWRRGYSPSKTSIHTASGTHHLMLKTDLIPYIRAFMQRYLPCVSAGPLEEATLRLQAGLGAGRSGMLPSHCPAWSSLEASVPQHGPVPFWRRVCASLVRCLLICDVREEHSSRSRGGELRVDFMCLGEHMHQAGMGRTDAEQGARAKACAKWKDEFEDALWSYKNST